MRKTLRIFAVGAPVYLACMTAGCQSSKPPATAASAPAAAVGPLQPYTAPDQSASAGVPAGWQVTKGGETVITMAGPQGVTVSLGNTYIAKNAAFQLGQRYPSGVDIAMPYSASLGEKLTMIVEDGAAVGGMQISQMAINSTTSIQLPASLGQCARMVASYTSSKGPQKMMVVFCSLPLDAGGDYKNIMLDGEGPAAIAAQAAPTVQAIFHSYKIPTAWLQRKLAPQNAAVAAVGSPGSGGKPSAAQLAMQNKEALAIDGEVAGEIQGADISSNCFTLSVIQETPTYALPRSCGGTRPD